VGAVSSQAIAEALENVKALQMEGSQVVARSSGGPICPSQLPTDSRVARRGRLTNQPTPALGLRLVGSLIATNRSSQGRILSEEQPTVPLRVAEVAHNASDEQARAAYRNRVYERAPSGALMDLEGRSRGDPHRDQLQRA
jgi:hypothetical protein